MVGRLRALGRSTATAKAAWFNSLRKISTSTFHGFESPLSADSDLVSSPRLHSAKFSTLALYTKKAQRHYRRRPSFVCCWRRCRGDLRLDPQTRARHTGLGSGS